MLKTMNCRTLAMSLLSGTILAAGVARAQSTAPPQEPAAQNAVPEIIVTVEKRSSSVNKVPLSINVFNGTQLATAGVRSTQDLAKVVPGFSTVTSFYGEPVYYLRGVGFYDNSVAARPAVTIYADEAPIPYSVMAMGTTLDLERAEVLKGPQGTLFGSRAR